MLFEAYNELITNFTQKGFYAKRDDMIRESKQQINIALNTLGGFNTSSIDEGRVKTDSEVMIFVYGNGNDTIFKVSDQTVEFLSNYSSRRISSISCQEPQLVEIGCDKCEYQIRATITVNKVK